MWQEIGALGIVALTIALVVRGVIRRRRRGAAGACHCLAGPAAPESSRTLIPPESLSRKGGRRAPAHGRARRAPPGGA